MIQITPFASRLLPAPRCGGFRLDDFWVWCGSVVRGEDGRFHLFASRWPKRHPFFHGYLAASEIVRASAEAPQGPLPFRGSDFSRARRALLGRARDAQPVRYPTRRRIPAFLHRRDLPRRDAFAGDAPDARRNRTQRLGCPWYRSIREIEDPFVFRSGDGYEMVCKDLTGRVTGEFHAGVHLFSPNGLDWQLAPQPKAWSRTVRWDDGTTQGSIERPFMLFENERPSYLFAATAGGSGPREGRPGHYFAQNTWNMVIPLQTNETRT